MGLIKKEVYLNPEKLTMFKNETIFRVHWECMGRLQGVEPWWHKQVFLELVW